MKSRSEYKRPTYTVQDTLTDKEINAMLEDYIEIELHDLPNIAINAHIRYFTVEQDKKGYARKIFRIGGNLVKVDNELRYIVLRNGKETWSVQTNHSIFYRQITVDEIKDEYEEIIEEYEKEIMELKTANKKLYDKIKGKSHKNKSDGEKRTLMSASKSVKDYATTTEKHIRL